MADERPAFQVINDLFAKHGLSAPPWKLRDELASHLLSHRRQPEAREGHFTQPLYPHPAAPSADKLRIAVEALEPKDRPTVDGPLTAEELEDRDAGWDRQFKLPENINAVFAAGSADWLPGRDDRRFFVFDELDKLPRHLGIDFGNGDSWHVAEWTRDAQGNLQVRHVSQGEFLGQDCENQYTGGQDF